MECYIHSNVPINDIVKIPHPQSGDIAMARKRF